ncbi:MAG: hypothetical protein JSR79_06100 [Proteobacteria bacterium]|nr:hypothetical protein [Pseudomonadota bacterium]
MTLEQIADAYYVRAGNTPVPLRHTDADLSLNEQHRRLTQILFTPVFREVRGDRRFVKICERIGLRQHWDDIGEEPDFLNPGAVTDSTNRQNGAAV